jgi:hypothetical protein
MALDRGAYPEKLGRWKAPIKKRRKKKSEVGVEKNNAEWTLRG